MKKKVKKDTPDEVRQKLYLFDWTPENLRQIRDELGLTQTDIAMVVDVTPNAISAIEREISANPWAIQCYGIILERYYAMQKGYIPKYINPKTHEILSWNFIRE